MVFESFKKNRYKTIPANDQSGEQRKGTNNMRVYRYQRPLRKATSTNVFGDSSKKTPNIFNHHAVIFCNTDFTDKNGMFLRHICEVNEVNTKAEASYEQLTEDSEEIDDEQMELIFEGEVASNDIAQFCVTYNNLDRSYALVRNNCQDFVDELLFHLAITCKFKVRISHVINTAVTFSKASCRAITGTLHSTVFDGLIRSAVSKNVINAAVNNVAPEIGKAAATQISNEAAESITSLIVKGAFTPWQLFQIPAELLMRFVGYMSLEKLFRRSSKTGKDEVENKADNLALSYGVGKAASFGVAVAVGCAFTPIGGAAAAGIWIVTEIVLSIVKHCLAKNDKFRSMFGGSDWLEFVKVIGKLYIPKLHGYFQKKRIEAVENDEIVDGESEEESGVEEIVEDDEGDDGIAAAFKDDEMRKRFREWYIANEQRKKKQ